MINTKYDRAMNNLLTKTYRLLDSDPRTLRTIAGDSGVNFHWLAKFKQRQFENPGVVTVERLFNHLKKAANNGG